jgi:hypothetical protein
MASGSAFWFLLRQTPRHEFIEIAAGKQISLDPGGAGGFHVAFLVADRKAHGANRRSARLWYVLSGACGHPAGGPANLFIMIGAIATSSLLSPCWRSHAEAA